MYYRLKENYRIRGWQGASAMLIDSENNYMEVPAREFSLLLLCDGITDFSVLPIGREDQALLESYVRDDILDLCEEPSPLEERQKYQFYDNRFVRSCFWSITGRCNYRCRHCYLDAPDAAFGSLSHEEALSVIDQMAECGVLEVDLSGGEPLVREDFWSLVDCMKEKGIRIGTIYTNGALLTRKVLEGFVERGMRPEISISFDGVGAHDWLRGVRGAEKAALKAFALCREYGFYTDAQMCIHRGNRETLRETVNVLKKYGVSALKTAPVTETELWLKHADGNEISLREYFDSVISYIPHFYEDGMPMEVTLSAVAVLCGGSTDYEVVPDSFGQISDDEERRNCYLCASARFNTYIAPDGRLLPCMPMAAYAEYSQFPKVQDPGLKKALSDSYYLQFVGRRVRDMEEQNRECAACPYFRRCGGGCRANALSIESIEGHLSEIAGELGAEGRLMGRDPYQCILFKEGYVDRIYETIQKSIDRYCL